MIPRWLHTPLRIPNALQHAPTLLQILRKHIFLLRNLREQDAKFVRDFADGVVVCLFAPVGEGGGDGGALATGGFVGRDDVGLGFYELVEFFGEVFLGGAAKTGKGERGVSGSRGCDGDVVVEVLL